ncbi:hypothetical protein L7F22_019782 [Adiantum nelumboides]|nr:hypothetical protein [Adiantum nelumboides]
MGIVDIVSLALLHPQELRALVTYKVWRDPLNDIKTNPDSGWERESMQRCWKLLDLTSRSFSAVIKELNGELSRVICLFYLPLRGLDTIEDDMTIDPQRKISLLLDFYKRLEQPGWTFSESGPNEKDRQLLIEFDTVIEEFNRLGAGYKTVISDITAKMGAGMASYIEASSKEPLKVDKWQDYDLYCHFVAGIVGEGLSRLFAESGIERPWLGDQLTLSNHMGLFLQKTNIIRDYAEDCAEGRFFWPRECWAQPGADFDSQAEVAQKGIVETSPGSGKFKAVAGPEGKRAMFVLNSMLLDAIRHATRALDYLSLLRDQSVFNFCAIPQVMAIATLNLMLNNPNVLKRNVKIRKSQAVQLIIRAVNPRDVSYQFLTFAREMRTKLDPSDPNFLKWSVELGKIEVWCETYYPSFISPGSEVREGDVRQAALTKYTNQRQNTARAKAMALGLLQAPKTGELDPRRAAMTQSEREEEDKREQKEMIKFFVIIMIFICLVMGVIALASWIIAWYVFQEGQDPFTLWLGEKYTEFIGGHASITDQEPSLLSWQGLQSLRKKIEL